MKVRVNFVINDPDVEDILMKLGAYKKAVFIRQAVMEFVKTEKGMRLFNRLLQTKDKKEVKNIDLDELL